MTRRRRRVEVRNAYNTPAYQATGPTYQAVISTYKSYLEKCPFASTIFAGAARRVINDNMKRRGDKELLKLEEVLEEIEMLSEKRMSEGLSQLNFTLGVFNCFFIVYIFGE